MTVRALLLECKCKAFCQLFSQIESSYPIIELEPSNHSARNMPLLRSPCSLTAHPTTCCVLSHTCRAGASKSSAIGEKSGNHSQRRNCS